MKLAVNLLLLLTLTYAASAQSWVRQNPFATLSQMYDVDFDGKYGLAVGADAVIYTTTNGGLNWIQQQPSPYARTIESAKVVPGTNGQVMMAGGDSILMVTHDGGKLWKTSYVEVPNIYKIQVLPGNIFLALGKDFGIYSTDNGLLWQPFNMPAFGVTAGHFTTIHKGWVALGEEDNVQIWYTDNGGFDWELRDPRLFDLVNGIEMLNDTVGFLASKDFVYKTIDGGHTWWRLHSVPTNYIRDLFVINEDNLWSSLDDGSIYFSNSGGSVWERRDPGLLNSNRTLGIWANTAGKVWAVGKYSSILYSPDFGQNWVDQLPAYKKTLFETDFYNAFTGIAGGADGTIMRTTTGGAIWERIIMPVEEDFYGVAITGDSTIIAGSYSGNVFVSHDLGDTWSMIGTSLGQITDLHALSTDVIFLSNKSGDVYRTKDGGENWSIVYDGPHALLGMTFYNNNLGWATGVSGRVVMTNNGGETWTVIANNFHYEFSDVFFTSPTEGWLASSKFIDSIWHTTDGGFNWQSIGLPVKTYWQGVAFMDQNVGWLVGGTDGAGYILRTNDGGQTWFVDHTSPDVMMGVFAIPNSETAWAVGFGGNIMKFSNCTSPPLFTDLRGNFEPCVGDTVNFVVEFSNVDIFDWTVPSDWQIIGNMNTSSIYLIASASPGIISVKGSDACGDTTPFLSSQVTPIPMPVVRISEDNGHLVSNTASGFYQWYMNGNPIPGANDPTFRPTVNGSYQLHYTTFTSGCEGISNVFRYGLFTPVFPDIDEITPFPNPANNSFTIKNTHGVSLTDGIKVLMTHLDGRVIEKEIMTGGQVSIQDVPPGLYTIQVFTDKKVLAGKLFVNR